MKRRRNTQLGLETLESRLAPAGNVTVTTDFNDTVYINGDSASNAFLIESTSIRSQIRITGLNSDGSATTINGQPSITLRLYDYDLYAQQILMDLGAGDDMVFFENATIETNIEIETGAGNDDVEFTVTQIRGLVSITGADVDDVTLDTFYNVDDFTIAVEKLGVIDINDARIDGDLSVSSMGSMNSTNDYVRIQNSYADNINITTDRASQVFVYTSGAGDLTVGTNRGGDHSFSVERNRFAGDVTLSTRGGNEPLFLGENEITGAVNITTRGGADRVDFDQMDEAGSVTVNTGGGNDTIYADQGTWGATDIRTGNGADTVTMFDIQFLSTLDIRTGGGNDQLDISGLSTDGDVNLYGQGGDDVFTILYGDFGADFNAFLAAGEDEMTVRNTTVGENVLWDGGSEQDALTDDGTNVVGGTKTVINFEA